MVKRLLLSSGFWQQRNTEIPTFLSHDTSNGGMWIKILSKNQYLVKCGNQTLQCDFHELLKILERRTIKDVGFSDACTFFLKNKKKLCTIAI